MSDIKTEELVYITVEGKRVPYKPIAFTKRELIRTGLESEYKERGESLDVPQIEIEVLGGEKLAIELSEENLVVDDNETETARRKDIWNKYLDTKKRFETELKKAHDNLQMSAILVELPEDETWINEQKKLHIHVPDDLEERRQHYIQTEVLTSFEDILEINSLIFTKSAIRDLSVQELAAAKDSFRHQILGTLKGQTEANTGAETDQNTAKE